jgi:anti-anti-sigma factor
MGSGQLSTRRLSDGTMVVDVRGELDLTSTATLRDSLSAEVIAMRPPGVVVDLGLVTHMDGDAIGALVSVQRNVGAVGVSLWVVNPDPSVARLLDAAGIGDALGYRRDTPDDHTAGLARRSEADTALMA